MVGLINTANRNLSVRLYYFLLLTFRQSAPLSFLAVRRFCIQYMFHVLRNLKKIFVIQRLFKLLVNGPGPKL